jgi:hypothetical protein
LIFLKTQFGEKKFTRTLPENVRKQDVVHFQGIRRYSCPALVIYRFNSINILPDSTLFQWIFPLKLSFPFFKKRLKHHSIMGILNILMKWRRVNLRAHIPHVLIHDVWTRNYYHWITQALPRLILVQQTGRPFVLILPEDHQSEFHVASLKSLNVESWQTIAGGNRYYHLRNLWYPSHDIQIGDYNDDLVLELRNKLMPVIVAPGLKRKKKVFIYRTSHERRRILNEDDVLQTFLSFGFEIVEFEKLSWPQQISLASNTAVLAGVHGAGLTNMIFMPPRSQVFELTTRINGEHYYYFALSNALSHRYFYQVCDPDQESVVQDANLMVDINKLRQNVTLMLTDAD